MRQFMGDERRRGKIVRSFDAVLLVLVLSTFFSE